MGEAYMALGGLGSGLSAGFPVGSPNSQQTPRFFEHEENMDFAMKLACTVIVWAIAVFIVFGVAWFIRDMWRASR
jgi:uncharacterized protein HemY